MRTSPAEEALLALADAVSDVSDPLVHDEAWLTVVEAIDRDPTLSTGAVWKRASAFLSPRVVPDLLRRRGDSHRAVAVEIDVCRGCVDLRQLQGWDAVAGSPELSRLITDLTNDDFARAPAPESLLEMALRSHDALVLAAVPRLLASPAAWAMCGALELAAVCSLELPAEVVVGWRSAATGRDKDPIRRSEIALLTATCRDEALLALLRPPLDDPASGGATVEPAITALAVALCLRGRTADRMLVDVLRAEPHAPAGLGLVAVARAGYLDQHTAWRVSALVQSGALAGATRAKAEAALAIARGAIPATAEGPVRIADDRLPPTGPLVDLRALRAMVREPGARPPSPDGWLSPARAALAMSLGEPAAPASLAQRVAVLERLTHDPVETVRTTALRALSRIAPGRLSLSIDPADLAAAPALIDLARRIPWLGPEGDELAAELLASDDEAMRQLGRIVLGERRRRIAREECWQRVGAALDRPESPVPAAFRCGEALRRIGDDETLWRIREQRSRTCVLAHPHLGLWLDRIAAGIRASRLVSARRWEDLWLHVEDEVELTQASLPWEDSAGPEVCCALYRTAAPWPMDGVRRGGALWPMDDGSCLQLVGRAHASLSGRIVYGGLHVGLMVFGRGRLAPARVQGEVFSWAPRRGQRLQLGSGEILELGIVSWNRDLATFVVLEPDDTRPSSPLREAVAMALPRPTPRRRG